MAKTMSPSVGSKTMTDGQITKAVSNYRALLEKHAGEFGSEAVQTVLGQQELVGEMLDVFRHHVEAISEMIVREVEVDYDIPPEEAIHATKRAEYLDRDDKVVAAMPRNGKGKKRVKVCFFPLHSIKSVCEVDAMYEERGLKPDPYAVAAVNKEDPSFGDDHSNGVQWKDENGCHCYAFFDRWRARREVHVARREDGWRAYWWVGGVPASS